MKGLEKNRNIYIRKGIICVDYQKDNIRIRRSTSLKKSGFALSFVKKYYTKFIGSASDKAEALLLYRKLEDEFFTRKINAGKQKMQGKNSGKNDCEYSINTICQAILAEKSFLKPNTVKLYKARIKTFLQFCDEYQITYADDFKREHNVDFLNFFINRKLSTGYIKMLARLANQVFTYALENDYIMKNVFVLPKMRSEIVEDTPSIFSLDEAIKLIRHANGELRTYLIIAFFTGARTGEILALTYGDFDFNANTIKINKTLSASGFVGSPKTKSSNRVIDMLGIVKEEMINRKFKLEERIFKLHRDMIRYYFDKLLRDLNFKRRKLYDTRHSFASIMLSRGEEPMWVGCKMMGHKDLSQTYESYAKYLPQDVKIRARFLQNVKL